MQLNKSLLLLSLIGCLFLCPSAFADLQSGDYYYTVSTSTNQATITGYAGSSGNVIIPSTLGGYTVTALNTYGSNHPFSGNQNITEITMPNSITSIGEKEFYGCSGLIGITLSSSLTTIPAYAFSNTFTTVPVAAMASVYILSGVTSIGDHAFEGCTGLYNVAIPYSTTSIGDYAFANSGVTGETIPDSVTSIGKNAFLNCTGLIAVSFGVGVTSIGDYAFANCTNLTGALSGAPSGVSFLVTVHGL